MTARTNRQYTENQKQQAERIKQRYTSRGMPPDEADRRATATVHDIAAGGSKGGSAAGRGKKLNTAPAKASGQVTSPTSPGRRRKLAAQPTSESVARGSQASNRGTTRVRGSRSAQASTTGTQRMSEALARQLICQRFARMATHGYGKFRARWFANEQRLQLQGETANRWESVPKGDYYGDNAKRLAAVLEAIRAKRNGLVEVHSHRKPDHATFEVRVQPAALETHRSDLAKFLEGQLFWD